MVAEGTKLLTTLQLKIAGLILAAVLLFGALEWYGAKREATGYQHGQAAQTDLDAKEFTTQLKQFQQTIQDAEAKIKTDDEQIAALEAQNKLLQSQFLALASQRQQVVQTVAKLPDAQVQSDIEAKLGGPLSDISIVRKADTIITEYPVVVAEVTNLQSQVTSIQGEVNGLNDKLNLVTVQRDSAISFSNNVVGYYVKAYDAAQQHHSLFVKIITLGLVRDKHLDLPAPTTLVVPVASK